MPRGDDGPDADVGRLYDRYGTALYRYALMILADSAGAEDVIQQVFTALISQRGHVRQEEHYLRRAVRNECYSALRRRGRNAGDGPLLELTAVQAAPDDRIALERAIRELPADQREGCTCTRSRGARSRRSRS